MRYVNMACVLISAFFFGFSFWQHQTWMMLYHAGAATANAIAIWMHYNWTDDVEEEG